MFLLRCNYWWLQGRTKCFRLLYSEICSYCFNSSWRYYKALKFLSPIFGDMFLLHGLKMIVLVLVGCFRLLYSEICSYSNKCGAYTEYLHACFRLLYSEICSYSRSTWSLSHSSQAVFVSYIRRYVLTVSSVFFAYHRSGFRLLYSEICSY